VKRLLLNLAVAVGILALAAVVLLAAVGLAVVIAR
jgi:hypothetical protein